MIKRKIVTIAAMVIAMMLSGCGKEMYEENKSGYTNVTSVQGVTFDMPESVLAQATAITSISPEEDYGYNTFLYKDGKGSYLLFNIGSIVVAVENTTNYELRDTKDVQQAISEKSLNGIWLETKEKFKYEDKEKDGVYKLIAEVAADVSITPDIYGMFTGKLAYIATDNYECTMFIGARRENNGSLTDSQEKIINHITKSLTINTETLPNEAVDIEDTNSTQTEEIADSEVIMDENTKESDSEIIEVEETEDNEYVVRKSNQKKTEDGYSDIYHLLSIGDTGKFKALTNDAAASTIGEITIEKLYTGKEAEEIIKKYCNSKEAKYEYKEPEDGYSYHVVEYKLDKSPSELYVNIKMEGLDGERLRYRGISCTTRTHDIFAYMTEDYGKLYCYYEIPNGCEEYILECGTRVEDSGDTACYIINNY